MNRYWDYSSKNLKIVIYILQQNTDGQKYLEKNEEIWQFELLRIKDLKFQTRQRGG